MVKFVYIFEDGTVSVADTAPTNVDLLCVGDGRLQVLKVSVATLPDPFTEQDVTVGVKVVELDEDGTELETGKAEIEDDAGEHCFHIPV